MATTSRVGLLRRVNGIPVERRPVRHFGGRWPRGHPIGYLFHYTAGCGSDLTNVLNQRGISVHFSVDRTGTIYEYVPVDNVAFHAFEAAFVYWGVEHNALPGRCDLTDEQLMVSARLTAALVEPTRRRWGFDIPLRKTQGPDLVPGFKDHTDGTRSTWNDNGHTDRLYRWSWSRYLTEVEAVLSGKEEDVLTPEQEDAVKFAQGQLKYLEGGLTGRAGAGQEGMAVRPSHLGGARRTRAHAGDADDGGARRASRVTSAPIRGRHGALLRTSPEVEPRRAERLREGRHFGRCRKE